MARSLVLVLIACVTWCSAAEGYPTTLLKKANIRFGPDTNAPIAGTLDATTPIEVLRVAKPGWFEIRFPRGCSAWMHEKNLLALEDGKKFQVTEDGARVRTDATLGSTIVVELKMGDVVDATGKNAGQWHSIYPDKAVAYVADKLVDRAKLPAEVGGAVVVAAAEGEALPADPVADHIDRLWQRAERTYGEYKSVANSDNQRALRLDWPGLSDQLAQVVTQHKQRAIQLQAQRFKDGVDRVVEAQRKHGHRPTETVPEPELQPVAVKPKPKPEQPKPEQPKPEQPKPEQVAKPEQPTVAKDPAKPADPAAVVDPAKPADPVPAATGDVTGLLNQAGGPSSAEGWLEQRDEPAVGSNHVLIDANSNVVAYLKVKAGATLSLSEYFWRLVVVSGARAGTHGDVPVLEIDQVAMPGR